MRNFIEIIPNSEVVSGTTIIKFSNFTDSENFLYLQEMSSTQEHSALA